MEKIFDTSGYHFHVLTIDGHKYWIGNELAHAFDYSTPTNMFKTMKKEDVHKKVIVKKQPKNANENWHKNRMEGLYDLAPLLMDSSATLKKDGAESHWGKINFDKLNTLILVREDTLQNYLTVYATKPDAKEIGKKLYKYFTKPEKEVEKVKKPENALQKLLRSEVEALQLGSEFRKWYLDKVEQSPYLKRMNYKKRSPNWLLYLMGFYNSLSSRFVVALGKNSAKKRLKKKGASSRMLNSNRAIIRSQHPPSGDYWTLIVSEYMRHVDSIMFLFLLTIKPTSIQFAEGKDSSSYINSSCPI